LIGDFELFHELPAGLAFFLSISFNFLFIFNYSVILLFPL